MRKKLLKPFLILTLLLTGPSFAQSQKKTAPTKKTAAKVAPKKKVPTKKTAPAKATAKKSLPPLSPPPMKSEEEKSLALCRSTYENLFKDHTLNIVVAFGYKDARPFRFVADRYERIEFIEKLMSACATDQDVLCEFTRSKKDIELFSRKVDVKDFGGIQVQLRVLMSSTNSDDEDNRSNPFQKWLSEHTNAAFLKEIKDGEVIFYNGHSRSGGGPDFSPPRLYANQSVDYGYYQKHQPGLKAIERALKKAKGQGTKLIGLFSCASSQHFVSAIKKQKSDVGVISSTSLLYHADALYNLSEAVKSLMMAKCRKDFEASLRSNDPRAGSRITGFF